MTNVVELLGAHEMLSTGVSGRQLDYWTTKGYLKPLESNPGSGYGRCWHPKERRVLAVMLRLIEAGLAVSVAADAARDALDEGTDYAYLSGDVVVYWGKLP